MRVNFSIVVDLAADLSSAKVSIGADIYPPPLEAAIVATEHMMTACAIQSNAGFERALELLVEGARKNKVTRSQGVPAQ